MFLFYGAQFFTGFAKGHTWVIGEACHDGWWGTNFTHNIFKQTFAIYLAVFSAVFNVFFICPFSPLHSSQGLSSGITVDDDLASVFIFLSLTDNDRGTQAVERLLEDKQRLTQKKDRKEKNI